VVLRRDDTHHTVKQHRCAASLNSAPITVNRFSFGGRYDDQPNAYTAAVAFGGALGEVMLPTGIAAPDGVIGVAESDGRQMD